MDHKFIDRESGCIKTQDGSDSALLRGRFALQYARGSGTTFDVEWSSGQGTRLTIAELKYFGSMNCQNDPVIMPNVTYVEWRIKDSMSIERKYVRK